MVIFTLSIIGQKYSFWELGPNNQNCEFKLKFVTQSNSNMQNSIVKFAFAVFNWKYRFWANLIQKIKIVSLTLNLVPRLIRICRIQWWCSLFPFSIASFVQKVHLAFSCYLINLPAIYSRRLEATGFFLILIKKLLFITDFLRNLVKFLSRSNTENFIIWH